MATPVVMAIGKETSNPLFSMIHLSQELTHLDVMRIVWNLFVLMYLLSYVAAKIWCFKFIIIEMSSFWFFAADVRSKSSEPMIYQEILNLTQVKFKIRGWLLGII